MRISTFTFILICVVTNLNFAKAEPIQEEMCNASEMSNAARYNCLSLKFKILNVKLDTDIASIIKYLPMPALLGEFENKEAEKSFYQRRAQEILNADRQWRKFSEAECKVASGIYEGGSGQGTAEILCRIDKVKERLKYLKSHEPYKSFRRTNLR